MSKCLEACPWAYSAGPPGVALYVLSANTLALTRTVTRNRPDAEQPSALNPHGQILYLSSSPLRENYQRIPSEDLPCYTAVLQQKRRSTCKTHVSDAGRQSAHASPSFGTCLLIFTDQETPAIPQVG